MNAGEVADRLLEMGATLRRLYVPGCAPRGHASIWPAIVRTEDEKFGAVRQRIGELENLYKSLGITVSQERLTREAYDLENPPHDPPSAEAISKMDEAMRWFGLIEHPLAKVTFGRRRVVWARAWGIRTGKISRQLGISRETVRVWWGDSCTQIAAKLAGAREILPIWQFPVKSQAA